MEPVLIRRRLNELPAGRDARILSGLREAGVKGPLGEVARTDAGKPYLPARPEICFSVSHSGELWICAVCGVPVGVDLQRHTDCPRERIARRFFHPDETAWLAERDFAPFFQVWAARESFVKCRGTGLFGEPAPFSVVREGHLAAPEGFRLSFPACEPGWSLALTVREERGEISE